MATTTKRRDGLLAGALGMFVLMSSTAAFAQRSETPPPRAGDNFAIRVYVLFEYDPSKVGPATRLLYSAMRAMMLPVDQGETQLLQWRDHTGAWIEYIRVRESD